ncbi:MAG: glycosyltransferase family 2 protein [Sporocytophaga sp.]|uniref:glycosyltransferase family 2 protein n=1 Tax=Sporocytophaga sp. TaxID=2231183 RepID=UPI001B1E6FAA|nr:glycosyltransferase family 2 protein [Sporocytophaga sp.]MBO9702733.1 glycosyltransferase family 2 protein [Sporocytophaga sp.]
MKYCIVSSGSQGNEKSGFYQWAKAFDTCVLTPDEFCYKVHSSETFDIIHVLCCDEEFEFIKKIGENPFLKGNALLVLSLNTYLPEAQEYLDQYRCLLSLADQVIACDLSIKNDIYEKTGILAKDLAHPFDFDFFNNEISDKVKKNTFLILSDKIKKCKRELGYTYWLLSLFFNVKITNPYDEERIIGESIKKSRYVLTLDNINDGGRVACLCAVAGSIMISTARYEAARVIFPLNVFPHGDMSRMREILKWIISSRTFRNYFKETALKNVLNFNWGNSKDSFLKLVGIQSCSQPVISKEIIYNNNFSINNEIKHLSGPVEIKYEEEQCIIVCLLKDGEEHLSSFLKHYRELGIIHFIFIDNGSEDNTLSILTHEIDVTIYQTVLPHKYFEIEIRRYIVEKHCKGRWCMVVDIDELFDFPLSDKYSFNDFIQYNRTNGFNAVAAYMLDMFSTEDHMTYDSEGLDLKATFKYFDISNVRKSPYFDSWNVAYNQWNSNKNEAIFSYWGGVRKSVFKGIKHDTILLKHPLIFLDDHIKPITNAHFSDRINLSDVTSVLYHYKFVPSFASKVNEINNKNNYVRFSQDEYRAYYNYLLRNKNISIKTVNATILGHVNELIENGFLVVSERYKEYMKRSDYKVLI